ncbi:hypothetical protein CFC21_069126, partial [Triticum aestivum]
CRPATSWRSSTSES